MQSRSQALEVFLRNPSIVAMFGSAGIHSMLVLFTGLKTAESLPPPPPLQVISLAPGNNTTTNLSSLLPSNGLLVPNGLPPINIGNIPEGPNAMEIGKGSPFLGSNRNTNGNSNPFNINLGNLITKNTPQQSSEGRTVIPKSIPPRLGQSATDPKQPQKTTDQSSTQPDNPYPGPNPIAKLPSFPVPDGGETPTTAPSDSTTAGASSSPTPLAGDANALVRDNWIALLKDRGQAYKQNISTQPARITADFSPEICKLKSEDSAEIGAVFGPDGSFTNNEKDMALMKGASSLPLSQIALTTVKNYRLPNPTGTYQAFTFKVDIPYSEAACNPGSSPAAAVNPSVSPTATIKPSPKANPSARRPLSKTDIFKTLEKPPAPQSSQVPSPQSPITPKGAETQSLEPLPSPSFALPNGEATSP